MGSLKVTQLDEAIAAALQVNPRASWTQISDLVQAPLSTVSRRGSALLEARYVVTTGLVDHLHAAVGVSSHLRISVRPGHVTDVAKKLAASPKARFVATDKAGTIVFVEYVVGRGHDPSTVSDLAHDAILGATSGLTIKKYQPIESWTSDHFTENQINRLRAGRSQPREEDVKRLKPLSENERAFCAVVASNARRSYPEIADAIGVSKTTARQIENALVSSGRLRYRSIFDTSLIGYSVEFMLFLFADPNRLDVIGKTLSELPSSRLVVGLTGTFNLLIIGALREFVELYDYMAHEIGQIVGINNYEVHVIGRVYKSGWIMNVVDDDPPSQWCAPANPEAAIGTRKDDA